ncbi:DUF6053 domain-containing protein [Lysobacter enzymogenes]
MRCLGNNSIGPEGPPTKASHKSPHKGLPQ